MRQPRHRRVVVDRGVGAGEQAGRSAGGCGGRRRVPLDRRGSGSGVLGHPGHARDRLRPGDRHRRAQRAGPHRQVTLRDSNRDHADSERDAPRRHSDCHHRPDAGGRARHHFRPAAWRLAPWTAGGDHSGDGDPARRTAGGADALPWSRCLAACAREGAGPQHSGRRTAGRHHRALRGQDRHIDRQSHDGQTPVVRGGGP